MEKKLRPEFRNDLARIIRRLSDKKGNTFGSRVTRAIAERAGEVYDELKSAEGRNNLSGLLARKYSVSKIHPYLYRENGCVNCHHLFFEESFKVEGVFAAVCFYIPTMFKGKEQKRELRLFDGVGSKSVEFYAAAGFIPDRS